MTTEKQAPSDLPLWFATYQCSPSGSLGLYSLSRMIHVNAATVEEARAEVIKQAYAREDIEHVRITKCELQEG